MSASASGVSLTRYAILAAHSLGKLSYGAALAAVHLIQTSVDTLDGFDTVHEVQYLLIRRHILDHKLRFAVYGQNEGAPGGFQLPDELACLAFKVGERVNIFADIEGDTHRISTFLDDSAQEGAKGINRGMDRQECLSYDGTMLYFTESDVLALLPMGEAIGLMQTAFERLAKGEAINQPRRRLILPTGSVLHYMAGSDGPYFGAKIYSAHARHGAHFLFLLYRSDDGQPLALMEANYLGQIRTGAVSGMATRYMARPDADTLGIIGSGFQARSQLSAMLAERAFKRIRVWSRDAEKRRALAAEGSAAFDTRVEAVDTAEEAVRGAGIVVTATNAKDPVLESDWIEQGTHINAMGSNQAKRRELPADLVQRADWIAVDGLQRGRGAEMRYS